MSRSGWVNRLTGMKKSYRTAAAAVVVIHLLVSIVHGMAHDGAKIYLSAAGNAFVYSVILAGPLAALGLIWFRQRFGAEVLAATMAGSLVFGVVMHFVIAGPDHVSHVASDTWRLPFQVTAALLAITEAAGFLIGILAIRRAPSRN